MKKLRSVLRRILLLSLPLSIVLCQQTFPDAGTDNILAFLISNSTLQGSATYLVGNLVLENAGMQYAIKGSGEFNLPANLNTGDAVKVTIASQPSNQTCILQNESGTATNTGFSGIIITCKALSVKIMYTGANLTTSSTCPTYANTGLSSLNITLGVSADVLITFSTHLSSDTATNSSSLRLLVNGVAVSLARADNLSVNQSISVTYFTIQSLNAGSHTISSDFCNTGGGQTMIFGTEKTVVTATALQSINGLLSHHNASVSGVSTSNVISYTDIGFTNASFNLTKSANVIAVLEAHDAKRDLNSLDMGIQHNGSIIADSTLSNGEPLDFLPITVLGSVPVGAGTHALNPAWKSGSIAANLSLGSLGSAYFSALALDATHPFGQDIASNTGLISTSSNTYGDVPNMTGINLNLSEATRVMIMLQAHDVVNSLSSGKNKFSINIDGGNIMEAIGQPVGNGFHTPISLITIETLSAGSHTIKLQWSTTAGTLSAGAGPHKIMLLAFAIE